MKQPIFQSDSTKFMALILPFVITGTTSVAIFSQHVFMWAFYLMAIVLTVVVMMALTNGYKRSGGL